MMVCSSIIVYSNVIVCSYLRDMVKTFEWDLIGDKYFAFRKGAYDG